MTKHTAPRRLRAGRRLIGVVQAAWGDRPVPLSLVRAIRRCAGGSIAPAGHATRASHLHEEALRPLLDGVELGTSTLGPRAIHELVATVERLRPEAVLEFGSGASTVALAWAMREVHGPSKPPRILSVEQDMHQGERTRGLLERAGLGDDAAVIVAPLADQVIEGTSTTCYALPDSLDNALGGRRVDLVLIGGPAGPSAIRFGTLPLARPFTRPWAIFLLDDALRDGELDVARRWATLPWVRLSGIRLIEKGMLVGTVTG